MKQVLLLFILSNLNVFSQQTSTATKKFTNTVEILKGSKQQMNSECGMGYTSIKQTVTTYNVQKPTYKICTLLWLQFSNIEGYECYGAWGYELMSITENKFTLLDVEKEKKRQTDKAFGLLNYLQREGNH